MLKTSSVVPSPDRQKQELHQGARGSLRLCDQGMAEWSNNGDPDDYPPRWVSRALAPIGARVGKVRISPHEVGIGNAVRPLRSKYFRLWRSAPITENRIDAAQRVGQACDTKRIAPFPSRSTP